MLLLVPGCLAGGSLSCIWDQISYCIWGQEGIILLGQITWTKRFSLLSLIVQGMAPFLGLSEHKLFYHIHCSGKDSGGTLVLPTPCQWHVIELFFHWLLGGCGLREELQ